MTARTIRWNGALRAQLLLLQRMGRVRVLVWAGLLSLVAAVVVEWGSPLSDATIVNEGFTLLTLHRFVVLAGAAWGIMLWWHEPPGRREQFLAAPVDVTAHESARIVAGGLWLLVLLLLATAATLAVQAAGGRIAALGNIAPEAWAALFSAPMLAYALAATVSTATRRSVEVVALGIVALGGLYLVVLRFMWGTGADVMALFEINRYSLFNALGGLGTATTTNYTEVTATSTVTTTSVVTGSHMSPYWLNATVLWWAIALGALAFVLWRRRRA